MMSCNGSTPEYDFECLKTPLAIPLIPILESLTGIISIALLERQSAVSFQVWPHTSLLFASSTGAATITK